MKGKRPDHGQITEYVRKIIARWLSHAPAAGNDGNGGNALDTGGDNGQDQGDLVANSPKGCGTLQEAQYGPWRPHDHWRTWL